MYLFSHKVTYGFYIFYFKLVKDIKITCLKVVLNNKSKEAARDQYHDLNVTNVFKFI